MPDYLIKFFVGFRLRIREQCHGQEKRVQNGDSRARSAFTYDLKECYYWDRDTDQWRRCPPHLWLFLHASLNLQTQRVLRHKWRFDYTIKLWMKVYKVINLSNCILGKQTINFRTWWTGSSRNLTMSSSHSFLDFPKTVRGKKGARIDIKMGDLSNRMATGVALSARCLQTPPQV